MKNEETIDFNHEVVKRMSKKDFVEQHKDHPAGIDFSAKYDEIVGKESEPKKPVEKTENPK